jgi:hypothetical protein
MWRGPDPSRGHRQSPDPAAELQPPLHHLAPATLDLMELVEGPSVVEIADGAESGRCLLGLCRQPLGGSGPRHMTLSRPPLLAARPGSVAQVSYVEARPGLRDSVSRTRLAGTQASPPSSTPACSSTVTRRSSNHSVSVSKAACTRVPGRTPDTSPQGRTAPPTPCPAGWLSTRPPANAADSPTNSGARDADYRSLPRCASPLPKRPCYCSGRGRSVGRDWNGVGTAPPQLTPGHLDSPAICRRPQQCGGGSSALIRTRPPQNMARGQWAGTWGRARKSLPCSPAKKRGSNV